MILFLAFDGVLRTTTREQSGQLDGQLVANFGSLLRRFSRLSVVFSTSWRLRQPQGELLAWFHRDLHARFIGRTPRLEATDPGGRQREILRWLERHGHGHSPWVALDTERSRFEPECERVEFCDPAQGLDAEAMARLEQRMVRLMSRREGLAGLQAGP